MTIVSLMAALPAFAGTIWTYEDYDLVNDKIWEFEDLSFERDEHFDDLLAPWRAAQDKTAPKLTLWVVWEEGNGVTHDEGIITTSRTIRVPRNAYVSIFATATESDGGAIDNVWLSGETSSSCADAMFGTQSQALWYADNPDPDLTDSVLYDWRLASVGFPVPPFRCLSGMSFTGGTAFFQATAVNHAGKVTTSPTVSFDLVP